ncbi:hypothetical protein [Streptomyces sp. NBC_01264]|uniref:hypothetical protein n=1 Tax=Streptomyces sp. NBC_01264 TaxID=2903804 RepID=UPI00225340D3|nr:hypothetical protein [Streptomyces sp. NBC_01264]MCX4781724.1 hypothetical protein [Streptomyces sp. NBC_01264]
MQPYLDEDTWDDLQNLVAMEASDLLYSGVAGALAVHASTAEASMQKILSAAVMARVIHSTAAVLTEDSWNAFVRRSFPAKFVDSSHSSGASSEDEHTYGYQRSSVMPIAQHTEPATGFLHATGAREVWERHCSRTADSRTSTSSPGCWQAMSAMWTPTCSGQ